MSRLSKLGRKAAPVANQIFGPKSWKIGAMIAGGAVAAKALGGGAAGGAIAGSLLPAVIGAGADIYSANQIAEGQAEANAAALAVENCAMYPALVAAALKVGKLVRLSRFSSASINAARSASRARMSGHDTALILAVSLWAARFWIYSIVSFCMVFILSG